MNRQQFSSVHHILTGELNVSISLFCGFVKACYTRDFMNIYYIYNNECWELFPQR